MNKYKIFEGFWMTRKINKTYTANKDEIQKKKWYLIDAEGLVLGRLAVIVADILRGKNKPTFTPNLDCGDYVVIVNAQKVALTGNKLQDKIYYWHTGYPGGLKSRTAEELLNGKHPEEVVYKAVQRMMTRNPLSRKVLKKMFIYTGPEHQHQAQQPEVLNLAELSSKNTKN